MVLTIEIKINDAGDAPPKTGVVCWGSIGTSLFKTLVFLKLLIRHKEKVAHNNQKLRIPSQIGIRMPNLAPIHSPQLTFIAVQEV